LHPVSPFLFVLAKQASTKSLSCQDGKNTIFENCLYVCRFSGTSDSSLTAPNVDRTSGYQHVKKVDIAVENGLSSPHLYLTVKVEVRAS
jgi:hypothetical protein